MSGASRRPLCLLWRSSARLAHSVEGPLFWGVWQDLRQAFLRVSGGRLTGQPWDRPRDRVGRWSRGARVCVVCVLSVRIYAKGAALPVRLQVVEAQRPVPPTMQGTECGAGGQGQGPGLLSAHPPNTCFIPPVGLRTFPPALSFWSRNFRGLSSPQPLARADQILRDSVPRNHLLELLVPWSPAARRGFSVVGPGQSGPAAPLIQARAGNRVRSQDSAHGAGLKRSLQSISQGDNLAFH